jgi:hypothetical protein
VVACLDRAGEQLVPVTGELVRTLRALDLGPDALLGRRSKASRADLLALEHVLRRDVLGELAGRRDCARDNCLAGHGLLLEHLLIDYVRARSTCRDVARRDEDRHFAFPALHVALVVDDVCARQDGGKCGQRDGDPDILGAIIHSPFSFP